MRLNVLFVGLRKEGEQGTIDVRYVKLLFAFVLVYILMKFNAS